jgi:hypothetical protein
MLASRYEVHVSHRLLPYTAYSSRSNCRRNQLRCSRGGHVLSHKISNGSHAGTEYILECPASRSMTMCKWPCCCDHHRQSAGASYDRSAYFNWLTFLFALSLPGEDLRTCRDCVLVMMPVCLWVLCFTCWDECLLKEGSVCCPCICCVHQVPVLVAWITELLIWLEGISHLIRSASTHARCALCSDKHVGQGILRLVKHVPVIIASNEIDLSALELLLERQVDDQISYLVFYRLSSRTYTKQDPCEAGAWFKVERVSHWPKVKIVVIMTLAEHSTVCQVAWVIYQLILKVNRRR